MSLEKRALPDAPLHDQFSLVRGLSILPISFTLAAGAAGVLTNNCAHCVSVARVDVGKYELHFPKGVPGGWAFINDKDEQTYQVESGSVEEGFLVLVRGPGAGVDPIGGGTIVRGFICLHTTGSL